MPPSATIDSLLESARRSLIETGKRNRLIHTPRGKKAKLLEIIDEKPDQVFATLFRRRADMTFLPGAPSREPDRDDDNDGEIGVYAPPDDDASGGAQRHNDTRLQTRLTPEGLQKRLLGFSRDSATIEQEQGINVLFLAVGFLRWFDPREPETAREAPLLLLPVDLSRESGRSAFRLRLRDDDLSENIALGQMLRNDFGIALPPLPDSDEWTASEYFARVRDEIGSQPGWSIAEDAIVLGFFSFSKILMYHDLNPEAWPDDGLRCHPLVAKLLGGGFDEEPVTFDEQHLDQSLRVEDLIHVVDADASQAVVIEMVRRGQNLVVQGPPGTGKSQTITNIIAAAARDGKSVLFMAEKLVALQVVHRRLKDVGLDPIALELHSRNANKRAMVERLADALAQPATPAVLPEEFRELAEVRGRLNREIDALHRPVSTSETSAYQAIGGQIDFMRRGAPPPAIGAADTGAWSRHELAEVEAGIARLCTLTNGAGLRTAHPLYGVTADNLQPLDIQRLAPSVAKAAAELGRLAALTTALTAGLGLTDGLMLRQARDLAALLAIVEARPPVPLPVYRALAATADFKRGEALIEQGLAFIEARKAVDVSFTPGTLDLDLSAERGALAAHGDSFFGRLSGDYRHANAAVAARERTPGVPLPTRLLALDGLAAAREMRAALAAESAFAATAFGPAWVGVERTDYARLAAAVGWIKALATAPLALGAAGFRAVIEGESLPSTAYELTRQLQAAAAALGKIAEVLRVDFTALFGVASAEDAGIEELTRRAGLWDANIARLAEWVELNAADARVRGMGLGALADRIGEGSLSTDAAVAEVRFARAEQIWQSAIAADPSLSGLNGNGRETLIQRFRDLERRRRQLAAREVLASHSAEMPRGSAGEMAVVRGEIARKRGHLPMRKLLERAGGVVQRIKPVMLMSPLSVSQFIPPGTLVFDLLVIDEASQVRPEDAIGAVARARQLVVVGDRHQLPPTNFFDRAVAGLDEDEDDEGALPSAPLGDLESVLTLCTARGMPDRTLSWHYRSRHPSLIEVSNYQFYKGRLFLPPSPMFEGGESGFRVSYVRGAYDRGNTRTNRIEAEAVVSAIVAHAQQRKDQSLGVVTFSTAQRNLLQSLLEAERRRVPELEALLQGAGREPFFVKNLENVQGDERDVIMVSIGYGPRAPGEALDSMAFGPVSVDGGERRLNVLFTRAKRRCEVFCSFLADDIDLSRASKEGARVLKRFLKFGETGKLDLPAPSGLGPDSPFEEAVAREIRAMGYAVDTQVGSAGFRIDLAVRDPRRAGRYLLAIECDGAAYHAAFWARERDRLRDEILTEFGWAVHRIWSTDWFRRGDDEVAKLKARIEQELATDLDAPVATAPEPTQEPVVAPPTTEAPAASPAAPVEAPVAGTEPTALAEPSQSAGGIVVTARDSPVGIETYREVALSVETDLAPHEVPVAEMAKIVRQIVEGEGPIHRDEISRRVAATFGKDRAGPRIAAAVIRALAEVDVDPAASDEGLVESDGFWDIAGRDARIRSRAGAASSLRRADMLPATEIAAAIVPLLRDNGAFAKGELVSAVARLFGFDRAGADLKARLGAVIDTLVEEGVLKFDGERYSSA